METYVNDLQIRLLMNTELISTLWRCALISKHPVLVSKVAKQPNFRITMFETHFGLFAIAKIKR